MFHGAYRADKTSNLGSVPTLIISKSKFKNVACIKLIDEISKYIYYAVVKNYNLKRLNIWAVNAIS